MIATPQTSGGGGVSAFGVELGEASTLGPGTPLSPGSTGPGTKKTGPVGPGLQCLDPSDIGGTHLFQELPANESMHLLRRLAAHPFSWLIRVLVTWVIVLCMGIYPVDILA